VQRIDIDGVPVFTAPGPERVTAALQFGVGLRDESYATIEVTHLIEHLVMGSLPKSHLDCNAMVDVETTTFHATGRPAAVAAFLTGVCESISRLPLDRMDQEVGVLQAEDCAGSHPTAAALWAARFGLAGPGLALVGAGMPDRLTEAVVLAHARRWFVRGNAVLIWHGPRPDDLRLPLPEGPRPERIATPARPQPGPVWLQGPTPGVGLLLTTRLRWDSAFDVALDVLRERMRDIARHERGLSYHADIEFLDVAPDHREVAVVVDAREGQEAEVARLLWQQYLELARTGPTVAELAHALGGLEEFLDSGDEAVLGELVKAAYAELVGIRYRPSADMLVAWRAVAPEEAAEALRRTLSTAVLVVPADVDPGELGSGIRQVPLCNVVPDLPPGTTYRPPLVARAVSRATRVRLVVNDDVLAHEDADGDRHVIPWSEVEAAVPALDGKGLFVVGRNLCGFEVHEDLYHRRAVEAVRAHIPAHLWLPEPRPVDAGKEPVPAVG
jgi:hypothetical protein